jgi:hypothetical protein
MNLRPDIRLQVTCWRLFGTVRPGCRRSGCAVSKTQPGTNGLIFPLQGKWGRCCLLGLMGLLPMLVLGLWAHHHAGSYRWTPDVQDLSLPVAYGALASMWTFGRRQYASFTFWFTLLTFWLFAAGGLSLARILAFAAWRD